MDFFRLSSESPLKGPFVFEKVPKCEEDSSPLKGSLRVSFKNVHTPRRYENRLIDTGFVGIRYIDVSPRGLEMIKDCVSNFFVSNPLVWSLSTRNFESRWFP